MEAQILLSKRSARVIIAALQYRQDEMERLWHKTLITGYRVRMEALRSIRLYIQKEAKTR